MYNSKKKKSKNGTVEVLDCSNLENGKPAKFLIVGDNIIIIDVLCSSPHPAPGSSGLEIFRRNPLHMNCHCIARNVFSVTL